MEISSRSDGDVGTDGRIWQSLLEKGLSRDLDVLRLDDDAVFVLQLLNFVNILLNELELFILREAVVHFGRVVLVYPISNILQLQNVICLLFLFLMICLLARFLDRQAEFLR